VIVEVHPNTEAGLPEYREHSLGRIRLGEADGPSMLVTYIRVFTTSFNEAPARSSADLILFKV
jgi:hypothetical protein